MLYVAEPMNQFQPVWQSKQQALKAYCLNIYCEEREKYSRTFEGFARKV